MLLQTKIVVFLVVVIIILIVILVWPQNDKNDTNVKIDTDIKITPNDTDIKMTPNEEGYYTHDIHGCKLTGGEIWCLDRKKCVKLNEERCDNPVCYEPTKFCEYKKMCIQPFEECI